MGSYDNIIKRADVAEWQTQQTQNLPVVTSCGFKSHHPHYYENRAGILPALFSFYADEPLEPRVQGLLSINASSVGSSGKRFAEPFS